jgi:hypothetical protein
MSLEPLNLVWTLRFDGLLLALHIAPYVNEMLAKSSLAFDANPTFGFLIVAFFNTFFGLEISASLAKCLHVVSFV